ncbi:MAG: FmdB family zinc ribbon protein [Acidobacteriota bacterium]
MPIYEYECEKCGKHHEIMQKITASPLTDCPECGGKLKRMISNTSFVLKGTGWYATDYPSNKTTPKTAKAGNGEKPEAKAAKTESKVEKKAETTTPASK